MSDTPIDDFQICTATTQAGKPCRYTAVPGSCPPLCELHGKSWLKGPHTSREIPQYGRYLAQLADRETLARLEERSQIAELVLTRVMLIRLVDHLLDPESGTAESKVFVPLIFRGIKLVSDLLKQIGGEGGGDQWEEVLDRLGDELDIDI